MNEESGISIQSDVGKQNKILRICPTCLGKGFFEDVDKEPDEGTNTTDEFNRNDATTYSLPKIKAPSKPRSKSVKNEWRLSNMTLPVLPSKSTPSSRQKCSSIKAPCPTISTKPNNWRKAQVLPPLKRDSSQLSKYSTDSNNDFLIEQKDISNVEDFAKITKKKLKSTNIDDIAAGVINTVHIARKGSDIAITLMPQVNRHLCTMLKSLKNFYIYIAFEAVKELYKIIPLISRPVCDVKPSIREGANDALDVVAANTPPQYIVRAVLGKGPRSKNAHIRESSARLLGHVVDSIGPESLINAFNLREMRKNIIECGFLFLDDQNGSVRKLGKEMIAKLLAVPEFEEVIMTDVSQMLHKRVEKTLLNLKYERQNVSLNK